MHSSACSPMLSPMHQEGTVVGAEGINNAGHGFLRVAFKPLVSKTNIGSDMMHMPTPDSGAQFDNLESVGSTWRAPVTSLQMRGFEPLSKASKTDPSILMKV